MNLHIANYLHIISNQMEKKSPQTEVKVNTNTSDDEKNRQPFAQPAGGIYSDSEHSGSSEGNGSGGNQSSLKNSGGKRLRKTLMFVAVAAVAVVAFTFFGVKKDNVDAQTKKQWEASFLAAQPIKVKLVEASQVKAAIASMQMPVTEKQKLQNELDVGHSRLVWVQLKDNCAEDGDIVRIDSGLFSQTVTIKNAGERIPVPEPPSGVMNVVGIHDGGGGITVEMMSGNSPVNLPVMNVGQAVGVPVVPLP